MKYVVIHNFYPPVSRGGASRVVEEKVRELKEQGHEVSVVSLQIPNPKSQIPSQTNTDEIRVGCFNIYHPLNDHKHHTLIRLVWWFFMIFNIPAAFKVRRVLKRENPDVVWTHNLYGMSFLIPFVLRSFNGLKWQHTVHDIQLVYPSGVLIKGEEEEFINTFFLRRWYERLVRLLFGSPTQVLFPSEWIQGFYEDRGFFAKSDKKVVRNFELGKKATPLSLSVPRAANAPLRGRGELRLLYVGQIERHKGILFFLNAIKKLQVTSYKLQVAVVGDGSALEESKRTAGSDDRTSFYGHVSRGEIDSFYKKADVVVVPSLTYENAPTVIYEAFENDTPVLAADIGGIPELIEEDRNGWLFKAGDEDDFLAKLKGFFGV